MNTGYWAGVNSAALGEYVTGAVEVGRAYQERMNARDEARRLQKESLQEGQQRQKEYIRALEVAKKTGQMPEEFQLTVPEDWLVGAYSLQVVALRELEAKDASHPLVASKLCRDLIRKKGKINFYKKKPSGGGSYDDYVPSENDAMIAMSVSKTAKTEEEEVKLREEVFTTMFVGA